MMIALTREKQQSWFSDWSNLLLVGLALYSVLFITWLIAGWGNEQMHTVVAEAGFLPLMLAGVVFAGRIVLLSSVDHRYRRAWAFIGIGFLSWLMADSIWAYYVIVDGYVPDASIADVAYIGAWVFLIAGILVFPTSRLSRSELIRYAIDYAIILISVAILVSYFVIGPELIGYATRASLGTYILLSYPVIDTLVVLVVASLMIRRPERGTLSVIVLLGLGLVIYSLADLRWVYLEVRGLEGHIGLLYSAWFIGQLLVCVAPQRHYDILAQGAGSPSSDRHTEVVRKVTPYVAAAFGSIVILTAGLPELVTRFGLIVILLMVLLGLLGARQAFTLRENARLTIEQVRRETEAQFRALVEYSSDVITVLDRDLIVQFQSHSIRELADHEPESFIGTPMREWAHQDDRDLVETTLISVVNGEADAVRFEWRAVHPDGHFFYLETIASNELKNPVINGLVLNSRDVTERKHLENELTYQAYHDALTKLPNRASFLNTFIRAVRNAGPGQGLGLIFIDLDHFKRTNDTLGHEAGDELLVKASERLSACLRPGDTLGRMGGDEFTVLLPGVRSEDEVRRVADRILRQSDQPLPVAGQVASISFSIGVSFTDSAETEPAELLRHADSAMYAAKRNGRGRVEVFEPWMEAELLSVERPRNVVTS